MQIRSKSKILQQIPYKEGSLFPRRQCVLAMYVESFFLNDETSILCEDANLRWKSNSDEILILDQETPQNFSLIFLLVPTDLITTNIILGSRIQFSDGREIPLFYLRSKTHEIGRIKPFENWDMLVFTTPFTRDLLSLDSRLGNTYRMLDFVSPTCSLTSLLEQAEAKPVLEQTIIQDFYEMRDGPLSDRIN